MRYRQTFYLLAGACLLFPPYSTTAIAAGPPTAVSNLPVVTGERPKVKQGKSDSAKQQTKRDKRQENQEAQKAK
jgi:hypothetical protein